MSSACFGLEFSLNDAGRRSSRSRWALGSFRSALVWEHNLMSTLKWLSWTHVATFSVSSDSCGPNKPNIGDCATEFCCTRRTAYLHFRSQVAQPRPLVVGESESSTMPRLALDVMAVGGVMAGEEQSKL